MTADDAVTAAAWSRCRVLLGQTKGLSLAQVQDEVQRGAKFVVFGFCAIGPLGFG